MFTFQIYESNESCTGQAARKNVLDDTGYSYLTFGEGLSARTSNISSSIPIDPLFVRTLQDA